MSAHDAAWPLGTVTVLGAHILDVLGRLVETIPPGQGSVRLREVLAGHPGERVRGADEQGPAAADGVEAAGRGRPDQKEHMS